MYVTIGKSDFSKTITDYKHLIFNNYNPFR
jgi:hypothetical protein